VAGRDSKRAPPGWKSTTLPLPHPTWLKWANFRICIIRYRVFRVTLKEFAKFVTLDKEFIILTRKFRVFSQSFHAKVGIISQIRPWVASFRILSSSLFFYNRTIRHSDNEMPTASLKHSSNLLLAFVSTVILGSGPVGTRYYIFILTELLNKLYIKFCNSK
jgi:hypothetical protein